MSTALRDWARRPGRGVVFDFNGTLSDDEPLVLQAFQSIFKKHLGWTLEQNDYYRRLAGLADREIIEAIVAQATPTDLSESTSLIERLLEDRHVQYADLVAQRSPISASAVRLVRLLEANDVPLAIVTGAQRRDVELVLDRAGLRDAIPVVVTAEDVLHGKPDPEGFLTGAARLGLDPVDLLVFEDSIAGVRGALAAGMRCIAVEGTCDRSTLLGVTDLVVSALGPDLMDGVLSDPDDSPFSTLRRTHAR